MGGEGLQLFATDSDCFRYVTVMQVVSIARAIVEEVGKKDYLTSMKDWSGKGKWGKVSITRSGNEK